MSDDQKATAAPVAPNADAEKDVQNVLSELKSEEQGSKEENAKPSNEEPSDKKEEKTTEDAEEARIVAEAAKLGQESEKTEANTETKGGSEKQRGSRGDAKGRGGGRPNRRNNSKFDPSTQKETDDPVEIRKQVSPGWSEGYKFGRVRCTNRLS